MRRIAAFVKRIEIFENPRPKPSIRENFEQLVCQLLFAELNAISVEGNGGDGGIDCYIKNDDGSIDVFQAKYFINTLGKSQKSQVRESLLTAQKTIMSGSGIVHGT